MVVDVSPWETATILGFLALISFSSLSSVKTVPHSVSTGKTSAPKRRAISTLRWPKRPNTGTRTRSPGSISEASAASIADARGAVDEERPAIRALEYAAIELRDLLHVFAELRIELAEELGAHRAQHAGVGVDRPGTHQQPRGRVEVAHPVLTHEDGASASGARCRCAGVIQTFLPRTCLRKRSSEASRPGRPTSRQCRPTDIMRGMRLPSS